MRTTRRGFLVGAAALAAGSAGLYAAGRLHGGAVRPRPLQIPPLLDARTHGQALALEVRAGTTEFYPGVPSDTFGYNGTYLGPTLRLHRGDDVQVAVTNALRQDTTVHWHGLVVPAELDGGPHQLIRPGAAWRPVLPVRQPGATLFYHSHVHGRTAEQVHRGLAGVLIVADDAHASLGLPSEYGVDDIPLVLQDRQFENGRVVFPAGMMVDMEGRRGETFLVNGTPNAVARVPARRVRLRLVNGSNARIYRLSFDDGRGFDWIASEGGLLAAPVPLRSISLAPGQRAEIVVDFGAGGAVALVTEPDANLPMMGTMGRLRQSLFVGKQRVMSFEAFQSPGTSAPLPSRLAPRGAADSSRATRKRRFVLGMGMGGGGMMGSGMGGGGMMMGRGMGMGVINGRAFDMSRIDERVRLGDTEIWEVEGAMMAHPFHIHGVHFEVLSRGGGAPAVEDQGLKDTVVVQEPVELLVRFTQPAVAAPFMYHCHILEHEDSGMMGQYATD